jgi:cardiolipin synthase
MNLDFLSMEWLEEGCLVVDDRVFAGEFERRWREDMARSVQMTGRDPHPRDQIARPGRGAAPAAAMTP